MYQLLGTAGLEGVNRMLFPLSILGFYIPESEKIRNAYGSAQRAQLTGAGARGM